MERRNRKHSLERVRVVVNTGPETLVQQQFVHECDVNTIVRRFGIGSLPARAGGVYGDFTGIVDYESAFAAIESANARFMELPAEARQKFGNDPARFLEYAGRVSAEELQDYCGLRPPDPTAPVVPAVVAPVVPAVVVPPVVPPPAA